MKYIGDKYLLEEIIGMALNLTHQEPFLNFDIRLVNNALFWGHTFSTGFQHRILINFKISRLLKTPKGSGLAYATLAHELGHIKFHNENVTENFTKEDFTLDFRILAEKGADQYALKLLAKIYSDPKNILLTQIERAFRKSVRNKNAKPQDIDLANIFYEERKKALTH